MLSKHIVTNHDKIVANYNTYLQRYRYQIIAVRQQGSVQVMQQSQW
jgi:hypothetical protein